MQREGNDIDFCACLSKLTPADLDALRARGELHGFATGDVVLSQGDNVDALGILQVGNLRVGRSYKQNILAEFTGLLGPGNAVGEISFLDNACASATLIADGDVKIVFVARSDVDEMIDADPSFAGRLYLSLFIELAHKLRATNQRVLPTES